MMRDHDSTYTQQKEGHGVSWLVYLICFLKLMARSLRRDCPVWPSAGRARSHDGDGEIHRGAPNKGRDSRNEALFDAHESGRSTTTTYMYIVLLTRLGLHFQGLTEGPERRLWGRDWADRGGTLFGRLNFWCHFMVVFIFAHVSATRRSEFMRLRFWGGRAVGRFWG
jgi:hypothetical protein